MAAAALWVNFDSSVGQEVKKKRPAIVISNNTSNKYYSRRTDRGRTNYQATIGLELKHGTQHHSATPTACPLERTCDAPLFHAGHSMPGVEHTLNLIGHCEYQKRSGHMIHVTWQMSMNGV